MTDLFGVRIWFRERDELVWELYGPYTRAAAEAACESMASGILRGLGWVHVERAVIVPW